RDHPVHLADQRSHAVRRRAGGQEDLRRTTGGHPVTGASLLIARPGSYAITVTACPYLDGCDLRYTAEFNGTVRDPLAIARDVVALAHGIMDPALMIGTVS